MKIRRAILQIIAGILAIWLAKEFLSEKEFIFEGTLKTLIIIGATLGIINVILKPVLDLITFPLKILTFGLFSLIIIMFLLWIVDIIFVELNIVGIKGLLKAGLIVWVLSFIANKL